MSIVYYKFIGGNGLDDIKENHYEVRLYSAKTGEEINIEDLFCVDFDKALLRFFFVIRKTGLGKECLMMIWKCWKDIIQIT